MEWTPPAVRHHCANGESASLRPRQGGVRMEHTTIAVDLAKSVFQVAVSHKPGRVDAERRLSRDRFLEYLAQQPPATVLLEACGSSHYWARRLQQCGHTVRLLPAHDVHRYVRRNKTDRTDTKALLEAGRNEDIHAVP